jgi:hypothetical protein
LAICLYATKSSTNNKVMGMMDQLMSLQNGGILSI